MPGAKELAPDTLPRCVLSEMGKRKSDDDGRDRTLACTDLAAHVEGAVGRGRRRGDDGAIATSGVWIPIGRVSLNAIPEGSENTYPEPDGPDGCPETLVPMLVGLSRMSELVLPL